MQKTEWYDHKPGVILLLILFWPVGLYALWKSSAFTTRTKGIITGALSVLILFLGTYDPLDDPDKPVQVGPQKSRVEIGHLGHRTMGRIFPAERQGLEQVKQFRTREDGKAVPIHRAYLRAHADCMKKRTCGWSVKRNPFGDGHLVAFLHDWTDIYGDSGTAVIGLWLVQDTEIIPVDGWAWTYMVVTPGYEYSEPFEKR